MTLIKWGFRGISGPCMCYTGCCGWCSTEGGRGLSWHCGRVQTGQPTCRAASSSSGKGTTSTARETQQPLGVPLCVLESEGRQSIQTGESPAQRAQEVRGRCLDFCEEVGSRRQNPASGGAQEPSCESPDWHGLQAIGGETALSLDKPGFKSWLHHLLCLVN